MTTIKEEYIRLNIGIDIDDTINKLSNTLKKYARAYNYQQKIEYEIDETKWYFEEAFGWDNKHITNFLSQYMEKSYKEVEEKDNAAKVINKLKENGSNIIIITARNEEHCTNIYNICKEWLDNKGFKYDKIETNSQDKAEKCIENNIDIFIDDVVEHCENVRKRTNARVFLMDSIYNQGQKIPGVERVYSWEEIYNKITN